MGSALFIRGTLSNTAQSRIDVATVFADVRTSSGELFTAGWSVLGPLEPDESTEFVLDLPVPAGVGAELLEYDLRAIGTKAQP